MSLEKKQSHLAYWCSLPLVAGFILEIVGVLMPAHSMIQRILFQHVLILETTAYCCLAVKSAMEHWHIPSAGFTLLAIATGIFFSQVKLEGGVNYQEGVAGVMFIIPGMILILYYLIFPLWLRIMGLLGTLPFIYLFFKIYYGSYQPNTFVENFSFVIFELTTLGWAYYAYKDERRRIKYGRIHQHEK